MTMNWSAEDLRWMQRALDLAARGQGLVEPNPMVGCVIVREQKIVAEGWHQRYGGPHAEVEALRLAGEAARGATMFVTLEPCCHSGKTPPCVDAMVPAGLQRVVIAEQDPFPLVNGGGMQRLRQAGIDVSSGLLEQHAHDLNAPFHKLIRTGRPWIIAKWAMSLDGKIATRTGDSKWISSQASRAVVHRIRGRVDAIIVGHGTVVADNPLLTARPSGPRVPARIVLDAQGQLSNECRLIQTAHEAPVWVVSAAGISRENSSRLQAAGCEVLPLSGMTWSERLPQILDELGRRRMTNVLIEGGSQVLGGFFDQGLVDELHVFVGPRIIGGAAAPSPIAGMGVEHLTSAFRLDHGHWEQLDHDLHFSARIKGSAGVEGVDFQVNK